jgi:hypothetical protein
MMTQQRPALALLLFCASLSACLDTVEEPPRKQIMLNQMDLEPILLNSLIGTPEALDLLTSQPLSSEFFDVEASTGALGQQLLDPYAKRFMDYLVRCALSPEDPAIVWDHPDDDLPEWAWRGRLGLCSEWATQAPSDECLELVSACLLASENALGKSVMISQRGLDLADEGLPLTDSVPVKALDEQGFTITSFKPCEVETSGAARNCGWSPDASFVGACVPEWNITLMCDANSERGVIRVCEGHTGCNHGSATQLVERDQMCAVAQEEVSLTCPASGSYAVMVGPLSSRGPTVSLTLNESMGQFPGSELTVFERREGAFFGTLFQDRSMYVEAYVDGAGVVHRDVPTGGGVHFINASMYACHDEAFASSDAYQNHRLCAIVKDTEKEKATLCAAHSLGPCHAGVAPICAIDDTPPQADDGDFDNCTGGGVEWHHPITVFLDHPCDLIDGFWCD